VDGGFPSASAWLFMPFPFTVELSNQFWGMHVFFWFPSIMYSRLPLPSDLELDLLVWSMPSFPYDLLYLLFFIAFNNIRWWFREVGSVQSCLIIG
jgi:hypothetical protein